VEDSRNGIVGIEISRVLRIKKQSNRKISKDLLIRIANFSFKKMNGNRMLNKMKNETLIIINIVYIVHK